MEWFKVIMLKYFKKSKNAVIKERRKLIFLSLAIIGMLTGASLGSGLVFGCFRISPIIQSSF